MTQTIWIPPEQRPAHRNRDWLHLLLADAGLFVVATIVMFLTDNPNLYPTVIPVGNFLVPVLFRHSAATHFRITGSVVLAYLFVALLHGLWEGLPRVQYIVVPPGIPISVVTLTLSALGIIVLVALYRQAKHRQVAPPGGVYDRGENQCQPIFS